MAAQLSRTNVRSRLGLRLWTARAISSFPVPVSPCNKTVDPVGATISIWSRTLRKAALLPTRSSKLYYARISDSRYKRSSSRRFLDALSRPYASALSNARDIPLRPDLRGPGTHLLNFLFGDFTDWNI